jgi:hypothetical protein
MTDAIRARNAAVGGFVPPRELEEYADRYAEHFALTRTDGLLEIRMHTGGAAARFSHRPPVVPVMTRSRVLPPRRPISHARQDRTCIRVNR